MEPHPVDPGSIASIASLQNPVFSRSDNVRDPAVLRMETEWQLLYTRYSNDDWNQPENWSVARVRTTDWRNFTGDRDLTPKGYASPGDVVSWHGRWVLPYESYPVHPSGLFYSHSENRHHWSEPVAFLAEVRELPWNHYRRAIDPTIVVDGERAWCFFTASVPGRGERPRANAIGLAVTRDPELRTWEIITRDAPLLGPSDDYPDGVENLTVFRRDSRWEMLYSAGLRGQRIATMWSEDLIHWHDPTPVALEPQWWCERVQGAPCLVEGMSQPTMLIMGGDANGRTRFGMAVETAPGSWRMLPARPRETEQKEHDLPF